MPSLSFLQIVDLCDNVELRRDAPDVLYDAKYAETEQLVPFTLTDALDSPIVGLLRPEIVKQLAFENDRSKEMKRDQVWKLRLNKDEHRALANGRSIGPCISFNNWVDSPEKRNLVLKELCERWRDTELFPDVCGPKKWRNEMYAIYADPFGPHDHPDHNKDGKPLNYAFEMERSACALFGVITYGVHMTIYEEDVDDKGKKTLRIWVPTRALTKPTWPGYLDNTVAGGIPSGMSPFESLVKECMEEASLPDDLVRDRIKATGAVSYFFRTSKGWLQPEVEYIYDIAVPTGVDRNLFKPKPLDGEVESFELMTQDQVIENLRAGKFKPNCGVGMILTIPPTQIKTAYSSLYLNTYSLSKRQAFFTSGGTQSRTRGDIMSGIGRGAFGLPAHFPPNAGILLFGRRARYTLRLMITIKAITTLMAALKKAAFMAKVMAWDAGCTFLNLVTPNRKPGNVTPQGHPGADGKWPDFIPPKDGDSRCSCPALNAMANHGILPHDGKNISFGEMGDKIRTTYNFSPSFCFFVPSYAAKMLNKDYKKDTFDLKDLDLHNGIEHDASLCSTSDARLQMLLRHSPNHI
ncbi:hypothetical protein NMY22_g12887 [Coprinellus aureogranulatus]|nr:hypothetical protein NMY22_g12887 [Coprinellus aureogranulatus]